MNRFFGATARLLLLLAALPCLLQAQSLSVFNVDASNFPLMKAKFYAFNKDGNRISGLSPADVQLFENGIPRTVTSVSCPPVSPPEAISSVLTIDISGSMSGSGIQAARAAARAWVNMLPLGKSECAVTTFNAYGYLNQDFTEDRSALLNSITKLITSGGTNYIAALLTPPAGSLEVSKRGRYKKVIVFLSDGMHGDSPNQSAVIAEAQRQSATIFGVILKSRAPQIVKDICSQTGGLWFEHIETEQEAEDVYRQILQTAQGGEPCTLEWASDGCGTDRVLELTLPASGATVQTSYQIPFATQPGLVYSPSQSMRFGEVAPGTKPQQQITITAQVKPIRIDGITLSNSWFSITAYGGSAPPFTLEAGQSRTLTVEYAPLDSTYAFCRFEVTGDACWGNLFYADGGWTSKQNQQVHIKVTRANGGEQFVVGTDEELTWEGVIPEEKVKLEYSTDNGGSWTLIESVAKGLRYMWRVPKTPSSQCLLRATANARQSFIGDMALIPAGTFRMGNITNHPDGLDHEQPVHDVTITNSFLMSRTEVTRAQYMAVMGGNPNELKDPDLPVVNVSWHGAVAFCNALSILEGLNPCYSGSGSSTLCDFSANGYRLPTEAEWEYACRGGEETDFYTGNVTNSNCTPLDPALDLAGWYCGNANSTSHPVALKAPNSFGLYDMHGNVYEWCWDWYSPDYYGSSPSADPHGPGSGTYRVLRGGNWNYQAKRSRSAHRFNDLPTVRWSDCGFRVVRTY